MDEDRDKPSQEEEASGDSPDEETRPSQEEQGPETISLLDLMRELGDLEPEEKEEGAGPETPAPLVGERRQPEAGDDEATPTGPPVPARLPQPDTPPLPLKAQDLEPPTRPTETDDQATRVQPRTAFPGQTQIRRPSGEAAQPKSAPPAKSEAVAGSRPARRPDLRPTQRPIRRSGQRPARQRPSGQPQREAARPTRPPRPASAPRRRIDWLGWMGRAAVITAILGLIGLVLGLAVASIGYVVIGSQLPPPSELRNRASTFETAMILDRNGEVLYSVSDPQTGNRSFVPLSEIALILQQATIATEDARFYSNPGFDPPAIARAIIQAAREGEAVSGASTITQQLARALLLDEDERTQRTFSRKVKEIILAAEIFRTYPKEEILELYLNEIYYGNRAYGIEAAAQTYFNKPAAVLNLAEASLLAGLPQAPALWDPFSAPEKALGRQREVLGLMVAAEYITLAQAQEAIEEAAPLVRNMQPPDIVVRHPHFTFTVLQQLEAEIGAQAIYRGGLRVFTTLDPVTQQAAEDTITDSRAAINAGGANNAALVALQPQTGEILALVGSVDFNDERINGQVNLALSPRQPGSAIKPLVYLSAMEQGWTPSTLIWDTRTEFPDPPNPVYVPKNFDDEFHGPVRMRLALGNSYNVPAVKALEFVGVCEFVANVQKVGLTSLSDPGCDEIGRPRNYGLSLALGGGEVTPLEMAGAYAVLANQGRYTRPFAISRIEDRSGALIFEHSPAPEPERQVVNPEHAYLLSHILSDNSARQPEFGSNNLLNIGGHRVAAKTGTSGTTGADVRDGWTIGYTPELVAAVWVGNTNNEPVAQGLSGYRLASPVWNRFVIDYLAGRQPVEFPRPAGIVDIEICADSGSIPGAGCDSRLSEVFAADQTPPDEAQDFLRPEFIDLWTGWIANDACTESVFEATFFNLVANGRPEVVERERLNARSWLETTAKGQAWAQQRGIAIPLRLPPADTCDPGGQRPEVIVSQPQALDSVTGEVEIRGTVKGPNYAGYAVDFGLSHDPQGWGPVQAVNSHTVEDGLLARWDAREVQGGPVTVRVTILGPDNPYTEEVDPVALEARVPLTLLEPTPTPTSTPTETPTPTNTPTATATGTATPTSTPTASATPVDTDPATATPTATSTQESLPTETPTATNTLPPPSEP